MIIHNLLTKINRNYILFNTFSGSGKTDCGPQLEKLDDKVFTIVAWDPRGYGESIPPERDFPVNFLHRDASDAAELMNVGAMYFNSHHSEICLMWDCEKITALVSLFTIQKHSKLHYSHYNHI